MPYAIGHQTKCIEKRNGHEFHNAFLHINGYVGGLQNPVLSHAEFNYPSKRALFSDTAYLNTLSSLSGAIKGKVLGTLGEEELAHYKAVSTYTGCMDGIDTIKGGELMIRTLVQKILPEDILYLRIVISERAQSALEKYYMNVGVALKSEGVILESSFYGGHGSIDGVCYHIR